MSFILNKKPKIKPDNAKGAYIYAEGQRYIDMCCGNGTHILGHQDWEVENGTLYGTPCKEAWDLADKIKKYSKKKYVALCNTGSEATMRAARIARSYTGKKKIAIFEGSWHGSSDWALDDLGVLSCVKDSIVRLPYNTDKAFYEIKKHDLAMVFVEPTQGSNPKDEAWFLYNLRKLTKERGILLGFDEVVTGFRLALGGGQEYFDVYADICTYGKLIGGGFPIGAVASSIPIKTFLGGTFSGNPVSVRAGLSTIEELEKTNPYPFLQEMGQRLRDEVKVDGMHIDGVGSFNRPIFTDIPINSRKERDLLENQALKKRIYAQLFKNGVYLGSNGLMFNSVAHTNEIISKVIRAFNIRRRTDTN